MPRKNAKNPLVKPYVKWAGGKRQLLPEIEKYIPRRFDTYFEPFVGAGAVLFSLCPEKAVINDFNTQLITTYRVIRDDVEELIRILSDHKSNNSEEYYYRIRGLDREESFGGMTDTEKAARFIFLNKTCYNGLYRVNLSGYFNVPYGRYADPAVCEEEVLRAVSGYLGDHQIEMRCGDFAAGVEGAEQGDFVYFDPPYHSPDRSNFTGYQAGGFNEEEQIRLRDTFVALSERKVKCLLSNSDTAFIRKIYRGYRFKIIGVTARRPINANSAGRGSVEEVLIKNW